MKKLLPMILFGGLLGLGACGGDAFDDAISGLKSHRDAMCKCKDADCAAKEKDSYEKFKDEQMKKLEGKKPSKSQDEAFDKAEDELEACYDKATGG